PGRGKLYRPIPSARSTSPTDSMYAHLTSSTLAARWISLTNSRRLSAGAITALPTLSSDLVPTNGWRTGSPPHPPQPDAGEDGDRATAPDPAFPTCSP